MRTTIKKEEKKEGEKGTIFFLFLKKNLFQGSREKPGNSGRDENHRYALWSVRVHKSCIFIGKQRGGNGSSPPPFC